MKTGERKRKQGTAGEEKTHTHTKKKKTPRPTLAQEIGKGELKLTGEGPV